MKCRKCGDAGASSSCAGTTPPSAPPDFVEFFRNQVREAIRKHRMFERDEPVLVAVSGGKDSLALWDVLIDEGYRTTGLYLDLGIFDYSVESRAKCEAFAAARGVPLLVRRVADEVGRAGAGHQAGHAAAALLGLRALSKRYLMNRVALDDGHAGRGHRPQPRRRGGHALRLGHALADGRAAAPVAGAGRRRIPSWCAA